MSAIHRVDLGLRVDCGSRADERPARNGCGKWGGRILGLLLQFIALVWRHYSYESTLLASRRLAASAANALAAFELLILTRQVATSGCKVTSQ